MNLVHKIKALYRHIRIRMSYLLCGFYGGYAPAPYSINLSVSKRCNLKCKMCDVGQRNTDIERYNYLAKSEELGLDSWISIIDQVKDYKPIINIAEVEPLLYKDIIPLLRYIKKQCNLRCFLITNGILLKDYAAELTQIGIDRIHVSIDGFPEIHNFIRGRDDAFAQSIAGIKEVINLRGGKEVPKVCINYAITNHNYKYLVETVNYIRDKEGIMFDDFIFIHHDFVTREMARVHNDKYKNYDFTTFGVSAANPCEVDTEILSRQIKGIKQLQKVLPVHFYREIKNEDLAGYYADHNGFCAGKRCYFPWMFCSIMPDGGACVMGRCFSGILGNVMDTGLLSLWNGRRFRDFRKEFRRKALSPVCSRCCGLAKTI